MKINSIISILFVAASAIVVACGCSTSQQELEAQASIPKADAEKTALAKAPGGTVKECELERERGRLVWSFDISVPGSVDITEVLVDAKTGEVVAVELETPAQQEKERLESAREKKGRQE